MDSRMGLAGYVDGFQRRHGWAGLPLAVGYKYADDQGGYLAALITYYAFLSIFPGLLLLVTVLGYLVPGNPELQQRILDTVLGKLPVIGPQLGQDITSLHGSPIAVVVGVLGLLYGVLGVGQATQLAFNQVWAVPRRERPNPLRSRVKSATLVLVLGAGILATTALTGIGSSSGSLSSRASGVVRLMVLVASVVVNVTLFVIIFRLLTAREVAVPDLIAGALLAALGWQALQTIGTTYLSRVVAHSSNIYGGFGVILGVLAWIYLGAVTVVVAAELNVVRACRLWPRSLLAPFADGLPISGADERAYASYVEMLQHKSFEHIEVRFNEPLDRSKGS